MHTMACYTLLGMLTCDDDVPLDTCFAAAYIAAITAPTRWAPVLQAYARRHGHSPSQQRDILRSAVHAVRQGSGYSTRG